MSVCPCNVVGLEETLLLYTNTGLMILGQRGGVTVSVLRRDLCTALDRQATVEPQGQVDTGSSELQGQRH